MARKEARPLNADRLKRSALWVNAEMELPYPASFKLDVTVSNIIRIKG
jgi:hypothetical protein